MANVKDCLIKSNVVITPASGWLERLVRSLSTLASLAETMKRKSECNERDTARGGHGMYNPHARVKNVAVDANCEKYNAENIEVVCSDTSALNVLSENEVHRTIGLRECIRARLGAGCTRR